MTPRPSVAKRDRAPRDVKVRFLRLSFYNIISNLLVPLAGLVDAAFLGHASIEALGGVALGAVLFDYIYWSFGFLRMSTTGLTAQAVGRGDDVEIDAALSRALGLACGIGGLVLALWWPLRELGFALLDGSAAVESNGRAYFDGRLWAAPFTLSNFALFGWFLGRERGRVALLLALTGNGLNIALDALFIVRFGWGASGAGIATALSQCAVTGVAVLILAREPRERRRRLLRAFVFLDLTVWSGEKLRRLVSLNRDITIRTLALVSVFAIFTNLAAGLGTVVLAAVTLMLRVVTLSAYVVDGFAFAIESIAGQLFAAGHGEALRRLVRGALMTGAGIGFAFGVAFVATPLLFEVLTDDAATLSRVASDVLWLVPVTTVGALAYIYDGVFLGLSAASTLRRTMLRAALIGFAPLAILGHHVGSVDLLWLAVTLFMVLRTTLLARELRLTIAVPPVSDC